MSLSLCFYIAHFGCIHYQQLVITEAVIEVRNPSAALQELNSKLLITQSKFWFWIKWNHSENIFNGEENNSVCFVLCFSAYIVVTGL